MSDPRPALPLVFDPPRRAKPPRHFADLDTAGRAAAVAELGFPAFRGKQLATSALELLRSYPFPGNVRELKNLIERAAYRDTTNEITPEDIGLLPSDEPIVSGAGFMEQVARFSRRLLEHALAESGGNRAEAARRLGLSYDQFRHYHRKHFASRG